MKGISVSLVALATTTMIASYALPSYSAEPTTTRVRRAVWPKWYYYDQIGLREWHKGDKQKALNYFDQSYRMCKNALGPTSSRPLDNATKTMVTDVINHQQFHLTVWRATPVNTARTVDELRQIANQPGGISINENEKQLAFVQEIESFAKRCLGEKHLLVQNLGRHRNLDLTDAQKKLWLEKVSQGKPTLGVVNRPKWYQQNERDFTPEMFTRNPRKLHEPGNDAQRKMDVTKMPDQRIEKGFTYIGGQKIDLNKKQPPPGKGWSTNSTVGSAEALDPKNGLSGWGNQQKNAADPRLDEANRWGVNPDDVIKMAPTKRKPWGNAGNEKDPIIDKPWGSGGAANDKDLENTQNQNSK
ncbi:MAG: hypothetical protein SGJ27_08470 [Candidatus Melainabacteria bacterium]|nr:hypothetical protein [Candidatus Melainabacteria bacterium]